MPKKSILDSVDVPVPCPKSWNEMIGDEKSRFCGSCEKKIHNISAMTRLEARKLLFESKERICIRLEKDASGKIKTLKKQLHQITRQTSIAAGVLSASLTLSALTYAQESPKPEQNKITITQTAKDRNNVSSVSISGTVQDSSGAVIPGTKINLHNTKDDSTRTTTSNDDGFYEFKNVEASVYDIEVPAGRGFKKFLYQNLTVSNDKNLTLTLTLNLLGEVVGVFVTPDYTLETIQAVLINDKVQLRKLISAGENVNKKDSGMTALHVAAEHGNLEMVKILLDAGAKVNAKNKSRRTPLLEIGESLNEPNAAEIVRLLISKGADVNVQDREGQTPLIMACDEGDLKVVKILLAAGANPNLKNKVGETAFDKTNSAEIKNLLTKFGARKSK